MEFPGLKQFERQIILDMKTMKAIMGTDMDMTIYRNLKQLNIYTVKQLTLWF